MGDRQEGGPGTGHVYQKLRQPRVLGHVSIGACDEDADLGLVREGSPYFLPADDVVVALAPRGQPESTEVGAGGRLTEQHAPFLFHRERRRQQAFALGVGAMREQGLRAIVKRYRIETRRRLQARMFDIFADDKLKLGIGAKSPRTRPRRNGVSAFRELTSCRTRVCLKERADYHAPWIAFTWN